MSDVFSLFDEEVDASKFDKVDGEKGSTLSTLIRQSMEIDEKIAEAEQYLKDLKFKKRKVNEEDIPNLMQEMGMDSVTVDGNKVALRQFVHARIADDRKDEAFTWLRSIGEADIIKNDVTVSFKSGEDNMAGAVIDDLRSQGLEPAQKTHVHPQTLKAWVKNRIESGQEIDFDTFGVFVGTEATIKRS
ncbi:MAG: hypothetical protein VXA34_00320 [Gammaproteobacteria bacterium]|jgi:hypothetical protein